MKVRTERHTTRSRAQRVVAAVAFVSAAFIVGGLGTGHGTFALWEEADPLTNATLEAASAAFSVSGFGASPQTYTASSTSLTSTIVITNTGTAGLQDFVATPSVTAGDSALWDAVSTTFTAAQGSAGSSWATWLQQLTLPAGQSASYTVTTALDPGTMSQFDGDTVTINVAITAYASTAGGAASGWTASDAQSNFTQTVSAPAATPTPTPTPTPTTTAPTLSCSGKVSQNFDAYAASDVELTWDNPVTDLLLANTSYNVYINDVLVTTQNEASTNSPRFAITSGSIPSNLLPAEGETVELTITVVPDLVGWPTGPILQATISVEVISPGNLQITAPTC